jgi:hypothetical protein
MEALCGLADVIEKRVEAAWAQVEKLPRTILERAMRGELVPTEAELARYEGREHEPAALLVAKILADREEERRPRLEALPRQIGPRPSGPRLAGRTAGNLGDPGDAPPGSPEETLAAFRQACWGAEAMTSAELLRKVELRLGGSLHPHRLAELLELAVERRILLPAGGLFLGATPKFARYDDDFLLGVIAGLLAGGLESDPRTLTRAVAIHLGYSQVTAAMRDRMEEVFAEGLRSGRLALRGSRICVPV